MPEIPTKGDVYASPEGDHYRVICVHAPFITARRRRGWAATLVNESAGTMHIVEMSILKGGGFTTAPAPH